MDAIVFPRALAALLATASANFQTSSPPARQVDAMKKISSLTGDWKGTGWTLSDRGERQEIVVAQRVEQKLADTALFVERTSRIARDSDRVVDSTLAMISYDDLNTRYRWQSHDLHGQSDERSSKLIDGAMKGRGLESTFSRGRTLVRFTIRFDGKKWQEVGEKNRQGEWTKFSEMSLERQK